MDVTQYAWAVWLSIPAAVTALAAVWTWWRGRAAKPPSASETIAAHRAYLDALTRRAVDTGSDDPS
jgi:hypothetical protein